MHLSVKEPAELLPLPCLSFRAFRIPSFAPFHSASFLSRMAQVRDGCRDSSAAVLVSTRAESTWAFPTKEFKGCDPFAALDHPHVIGRIAC